MLLLSATRSDLSHINIPHIHDEKTRWLWLFQESDRSWKKIVLCVVSSYFLLLSFFSSVEMWDDFDLFPNRNPLLFYLDRMFLHAQGHRVQSDFFWFSGEQSHFIFVFLGLTWGQISTRLSTKCSLVGKLPCTRGLPRVCGAVASVTL